MPRSAIVATALLASALLLSGCTTGTDTSPSPSPASPSPSALVGPTEEPKTTCDKGALTYLDAVASAKGTDPTRLSVPKDSGYPKEIPQPGCAVQWTNEKGLASYGGLYPNSTAAQFAAMLTSLKSAGVAVEADTPDAGMTELYGVGLLSGDDIVQGGHLFFLTVDKKNGINTPSMVLVWEHILT
jgi:hypothetical protein